MLFLFLVVRCTSVVRAIIVAVGGVAVDVTVVVIVVNGSMMIL